MAALFHAHKKTLPGLRQGNKNQLRGKNT